MRRWRATGARSPAPLSWPAAWMATSAGEWDRSRPCAHPCVSSRRLCAGVCTHTLAAVGGPTEAAAPCSAPLRALRLPGPSSQAPCDPDCCRCTGYRPIVDVCKARGPAVGPELWPPPTCPHPSTHHNHNHHHNQPPPGLSTVLRPWAACPPGLPAPPLSWRRQSFGCWGGTASLRLCRRMHLHLRTSRACAAPCPAAGPSALSPPSPPSPPCVQSFAPGVDIEDLGLHSPLAGGAAVPAPCPMLQEPGTPPAIDGKVRPAICAAPEPAGIGGGSDGAVPRWRRGNSCCAALRTTHRSLCRPASPCPAKPGCPAPLTLQPDYSRLAGQGVRLPLPCPTMWQRVAMHRLACHCGLLRPALRPPNARPPALRPLQPSLRIEAGGRTWLAPATLEELVQACTAHGAAGNGAPAPPPRFLAGNTGAGACSTALHLGGWEWGQVDITCRLCAAPARSFMGSDAPWPPAPPRVRPQPQQNPPPGLHAQGRLLRTIARRPVSSPVACPGQAGGGAGPR